MAATTPTQTIEHIVLFKTKPNSNTTQMLTSLNGLISLDQVTHIAAAPLIRTGSDFTHMLHSRYTSKEDLAAYSSHPSHVSVVKDSVLPNCDDIMAVDWVGDVPPKGIVPGSAIRVTFLKLKEGLGEEVKDKVLEVIRSIKDCFGGKISELSYGENFSPARAKGFSIAALAVFPGASEMEAVDANGEVTNLLKEKVRDYLDGVIVCDYVVPSTL
ncbi:hypothetical protein ACFE04_014471 [Oxalis oulophora]